MNMKVEAVARAICEAEGLTPDAMIDDPDYVGGVRSGDHTQVVQWQAKSPTRKELSGFSHL